MKKKVMCDFSLFLMLLYIVFVAMLGIAGTIFQKNFKDQFFELQLHFDWIALSRSNWPNQVTIDLIWPIYAKMTYFFWLQQMKWNNTIFNVSKCRLDWITIFRSNWPNLTYLCQKLPTYQWHNTIFNVLNFVLIELLLVGQIDLIKS